SYEWDLDNDGSYETAGVDAVFNATSDGVFTVGLRVWDDDGAWDTDTATVIVSNVAPTADAGGPYFGDEGSDVTLDASASSDPGGDPLTFLWDLDGDGLIGETGAAAARGDEVGESPTFSTTIDDVYTVRLVVYDDLGLFDVTTATVTVANVAPTAEAGGPYTGDEGSDVTLSASASTDPGLDIALYEWDLDEDGVFGETGAAAEHGDEVGISPTFNSTDDGPHTVGVRVTDDDGAWDIDTATVTLDNVRPTADAGGTYYVDEGATLQLDGSGSTDPGNDIVSYLWDLDEDGVFGETGIAAEHGDEMGIDPTFSAAGIEGPVSLTVSLRVTDDQGETHTDDATLWVTEPLGPVDFLEMDNLTLSPDTSPGELWYSLETTHEGFLTIVSLSYNGAVTLYDAGANPLTGSPAQRFDYEVGAGERYLFQVTGSGGNVDLRLANLVHQDGASVTVYGTDAVDTFRFDATASRLVTINEVPYHFTDAEATSVSFDGAAESDKAFLTGNAQKETVELWPDHGTLKGAGYALTLASTEAVTFHGGGGRNVARLHDSPQSDFLSAEPNKAVFYDGLTFRHEVDQVRNVFAYAEAGGFDTAALHGLTGAADTFIGKPDYGEMYDGASYYNYAGGFEKLSATGTLEPGFDDKAQLYDGAGHDVFDAEPHEGIMTYDGAAGHSVAVTGFRTLVGYATGGGTDTANLKDSSNSRDIFIGKPTYGQLYDGKTFFSGDFYQAAVGFEQLNATATAGFNDQARLYDGPGHDVFDSTPDSATMNYNGNPNGNSVNATGFRSTVGYATSGGIDVAYLLDSPDSLDTFIANPNWAKLYDGATFYEAAVGFEQTIATASAVAVTSAGDTASAAAGFPDKAKLFDGPGDDVFDTAPNTGILKFNGSTENFIQAVGFRSVIGYGRKGGADTANLLDSDTSKDFFTAYASYGSRQETFVKIKDGATHYEAAVDFQKITATASAGDGFNDKAQLYDGRGDDFFDAAPNDGTLRINGEQDHFLRAVDFFSVIGLATEGGIDNAILRDSPDSKDYFFADPDYGKLYDGTTFYEAAIGFEHLTGAATPDTVFN
ncbi:MAG: hypothetical protein HQ582_25345, partial [Planctomycetes bacterium]|nr:hypothetical protein [Planctomycetota bacterium]